MTTPSETYPLRYGDQARKIIDYTNDEDHFRIEHLEVEFPYLARKLGGRGVFLARAEDNPAGTFKWRGAMVGAYLLQEEGVESIVVPSAGNHARGAVYAARTLDMEAHIVIPTTAPPAKKEGLRELWDSPQLNVHAVGASFNDALDFAVAHPEFGTLLHPFDDPRVASGQGTLVDDILESQPNTQHIVVPVGGGGLLSGIRNRLDELDRRDVVVHGVEASGSNSLSQSLARQEVTAATAPNPRYGGSAVRKTGKHTLAVCMHSANVQLVGVTDETVDSLIEGYAQTRHDLIREATPPYEPTSLVALAGLTQICHNTQGDVVVVGTGHNAPLYTPPTSRLHPQYVAAGTFPK